MTATTGTTSYPPPSKDALAVDATDITATSATVSVTPADKQATYLMQVAAASEITSDASYAAKLVADAKAGGKSLADALLKGDKSELRSGLTPGNDYCVFAVYVNEKGECGTIAKKPFKTLSDEPDVPEPGLFTIRTSNLRAANFTLDIEADPSLGNYYVGVVDAATAQAEYGSDRNLIAADFMEMEKGYQTDFTEVDNVWIFNGNGQVEVFNAWMLTGGTEYNIYVFGVGADGSITTEVEVGNVTLPAAAMTSETITIEVSDIEEDGAVVTMTVSDRHLPYFCDCIAASEIEGMSDAQIVAYVAESYGAYLTYALALDDYKYDGRGYLDAGTKYYAVAFGYATDAADNPVATTAVAKEAFTTAGSSTPEPSVDMSFAFDVQVHALNDIDVSVTPSDDTVTYMWDIISATNYNGLGANDEAITTFLSYLFADYAGDGYDAAAVIAALGVKGADSYNYTGLAGGTTYYVWAVGIDSKGNPITKPGLSEPFTTPEGGRGDETVEVAFSKYYDGDALAAADPVNFGDTGGLAYLPATITASAGAAHWYVAVFLGDYSDPASIEESTIISALRNGEQVLKDTSVGNFVLSWDKTLTLLGMAEDADGNAGPIFRKAFTLTKSGASPVSDLLNRSSAAAKRPAGMRAASVGMTSMPLFTKAPLDLWMNRELRPAASFASARKSSVSGRIAAKAEAAKSPAGKFGKR